MSRRLHDSEIKSISFSGNGVKIEFVGETDDMFTLVAKGVLFFSCDGMKDRNIVFELKDNIPSVDRVKKLIEKKMNPNSTESLEYINQLRIGELKFFSISSSYGAEVEAICRHWELKKV